MQLSKGEFQKHNKNAVDIHDAACPGGTELPEFSGFRL